MLTQNQNSNARNLPRLLFADPDARFIRAIRDDRKAALFTPIVVEQGHQAMAALNDNSMELAGIFIGTALAGPDAVSVIRAAHHLRPAVPIFILSDAGVMPFDEDTLHKMGVAGLMPKSTTFGEIAKQFYPPALLFDPQEAIQAASIDPATAGQESTSKEQEFISIPARSFLAGKTSYFDIFVRLESGKFLKILRAGEEFSPDRLTTYLANGLTHFHIRREMQEQYLAFCDKLISAIVSKATLPTAVKVAQTLSHGERTLEYLKSAIDLELQHLQFALSYVKTLMSLVEEIHLREQSRVIDSFFGNPEALDHCTGVAVVAALLAKDLGFETRKSISIIGISSLLHDIALYRPGVEISHEDESQMTPEQKKIFLNHPLQGSNILAALTGVDPVVAQAVSNHHRRRNGTGFPNAAGMGVSQIPLPAEIVGLADEFVRLIHGTPALTREALETQLELSVLPGFSNEVADSLRKLLRFKG